MITLENQLLDISEIEKLALNFSKNLKVGDIIMMKGDLGSGKTTFARFLINNLYSLNQLTKPNSINSPTYPILITYELSSYDIYHYDFYRVRNFNEVEELDFFSNIGNSITIIEWPEILLKERFRYNHYLINLELHSENTRLINIKYINKLL